MLVFKPNLRLSFFLFENGSFRDGDGSKIQILVGGDDDVDCWIRIQISMMDPVPAVGSRVYRPVEFGSDERGIGSVRSREKAPMGKAFGPPPENFFFGGSFLEFQSFDSTNG